MTRVRIMILGLTMTAAVATPAQAFNLTGTWTGTRKCQDLFSGVKEKFNAAVATPQKRVDKKP